LELSHCSAAGQARSSAAASARIEVAERHRLLEGQPELGEHRHAGAACPR
jgi:hypothetical protein